MRIGFLTHEPFWPPSGGGSAEAVYLVEELLTRNHAVDLFCPRFDPGKLPMDASKLSVHPFKLWPMGRYTSLRTIKYLAYPLFLQRMVLQAWNKTDPSNRPEILVSQHAISAAAAGRLRQRLGIPVVMNFLDFLTGFMEAWPRWKMPRSILRRLMHYERHLPSTCMADGIMTVSDPLAESFADAGYPKGRIRPIYYGYDSKLFPLRETAPDPTAPPVIVMHGSFDEHHLGPVAREAVLSVHRQCPDALFQFVGRPTAALDRFIHYLREKTPTVKLERTGFVSYSRISKHLSQASLGIIPYEASNGTHCAFVAKAVEYLGTGLPVVSTRLKNLSRYFHDDPRIRFSEFNGADFARHILAWLNDPRLNDMETTRQSAERVREKLDWSAIRRNAVDFIEHTAHEFRRK